MRRLHGNWNRNVGPRRVKLFVFVFYTLETKKDKRNIQKRYK